ncbi:hypothetical protein ABIE40_005124 [Rhizobium sp. OAE497]
MNGRSLTTFELLTSLPSAAAKTHAARCRLAIAGAILTQNSDLQETSRTKTTAGIPDRRAIKLAPKPTRNRRTEKGR